ncbi:MAG: class I SAM-dependent methyltransferase [Candidatus Aminicenantes bacterium]|nr:MAG: class I SAM-dependent methyltransferase [Candidatus Aminicenantes bacterium]
MTIKEFLRFKGYQANCRRKRGEIFKQYLNPKEEDLILDLGGGTGAYISQFIPFKKNVYVADIDEKELKKSAEEGFKTCVLNEDGTVPYEDGYFDIIFCSSVIEHVTVDKKDMEAIQSSKEFQKLALKRQKRFSDEICRVGKSYFVQTPNKYFPLESHSRLPFIIVLLPRKMQTKTIKFFRKFWFSRTSPDWNLLTVESMKGLFPGAEIIKEKILGFTKSIMAVKPKNG